MDPTNKNGLVEKSKIRRIVMEQSGPIPSPEILAKYEKVFQGSAERIMVMAKEQALHRLMEILQLGTKVLQ